MEDLNSANPEVRLKAVRSIKNSVIGCSYRKKILCQQGIIPEMVRILQTDGDDTVRSHAATILGSLAYETIQTQAVIFGNEVLSSLINCMESSHAGLASAATRSLRIIVEQSRNQNDTACTQIVPDVALLTRLLQTGSETAESASKLISYYIQKKVLLESNSCVDAMVAILIDQKPKKPSLQIQLLSSLSDLLLQFTDDASIPVSMKSPEFTSYLHNALVVDSTLDLRLCASQIAIRLQSAATVKDIDDVEQLVLPLVCQSLSSKKFSVRIKAADCLSDVASLFPDMSGTNVDLDIVDKILGYFAIQPDCDAQEEQLKLHEAAFLALASLASSGKLYCQKILSSSLFSHFHSAFTSPSAELRYASLHCARPLTRSIKVLRTTIADSTLDIDALALIDDPDSRVQKEAMFLLCNLLIGASPMKKKLIDAGVLDKLASRVGSLDSEIRVQALWAIKNVLFEADIPLVHRALAALEATRISFPDLCQDANMDVRVQFFSVMRNIIFGSNQELVEDVLGRLGGTHQFLGIILGLLELPHSKMALQILFMLANMCQRDFLLDDIINCPALLRRLVHILETNDASLVEPSLWSLTNLLEKSPRAKVPGVISLLKSFGVDHHVRQLKVDTAELKARSRVLLELITKEESAQELADAMLSNN